MAKIIQTNIVISVSKLVKEAGVEGVEIPADLKENLEALVE